MKRILFFLALLFTLSAAAQQTYNPVNGTLSNKPYAPAQAVPTDMRSFYYDSLNFTFRAYQDTIEVLSYLNLPKWRGGNYLIYVNDDGVLNPNGTFTGGTVEAWWFKDGVADSNLVLFAGGGGSSVNGDSTLFPLIGTRFAQGTVTGDLAGNTLITQNGNIVNVLPNTNELRVLNNAAEWFQISPPQKNSFIRAINSDSSFTSQFLASPYDDFPGFSAFTTDGSGSYVTVEGSLRHGFTHFVATDATGDTLVQTDMFLYAKQNGIFKAAGFEILSQQGDPYIHVIGNTLAQTITFDADNVFPRNGTPGIGKVPTGTDALGSWTWQLGGGGGGDTTLTWEQTLNNQGAIPFAVAHNTDLNGNNFTLSNANLFTINTNTSNSPYSSFQIAPTYHNLITAGDSTEASALVQNSNTPSTTNAELRASNNNTSRSHIVRVNLDSILIQGSLSGVPTTDLRIRGLPYGNDTSSIKPMAIGTDGKVYKSSWYGVGGGLGARDTAALIQGYGTLINNIEGEYRPNKPDVLIAVDTSVIATKYDITIITNSDTAVFIVDSIANAPTGSEPNGTKYLVGTSPTGLFATHANDIAELIGGTWTFTDPVAQQQLIVDNSVTYATYQFNGTNWIQTSILWRVGGNRGIGQNAFIGRVDKAPYTMRAWNKPVLRLDTTRDVKFYKFIGTRPGNYAKFDSVTGNIDTGFFRPLIEGANITITPGPIGDTISSTGSGGTVISASAGFTLHGTGIGVYQDSIIYKDTTKGWVGINTTTPASLFDIHLMGFPNTVSVTNGSAAVTGTGTRFLDQFKSGDSIYIDNTNHVRIQSVASNTSLTLLVPYPGTTAGTAPYTNPQTARGVLRLAGNGRVYQYGAPFMFNGNVSDGNSAYGYNSLRSLTTGTFNTAIGIDVLGLNTGAVQNTGIGYKALSKNTGSYNSALGSNAMLNSTTGESNAAFGAFALYTNTTGSYNTAVGSEALLFNTTAGFNTAVGYESQYASTGSQNTSIGYLSLANTGGSQNTAIGYDAVRFSNVSEVTAVGYSALRTTGNSSTAVGYGAGISSPGTNNVFIGARSGAANAGSAFVFSGSGSLMIGTGATLMQSESNAANIFNTIWIDANNGADSTASTTSRVGINNTTPDASAVLDLTSTTMGFLPPRMTATQASAISSPAEGLLVYVTNTNGTFTSKGWWGWNGAAWEKLNN